MIRLAGGAPLPHALKGGIAALGNFDGFHRGHQAVVGRAVAWARAEGRPAIVGTFDPHPARLFRPDLPPFALGTIEQRLELLAGAGVDAAVVWRFDAGFAAIGHEAFVADLLRRDLQLTGVVTGWDFTFGAGRGGTVATLALADGLAAEAVPPVQIDGPPVSSTRIRAALIAGDPGEAARLLTRPFTVRGEVEHGAKLGRTLGFPTLNMALGDYVRPRFGVYAARATLPDGRRCDGVANLGVRPMFEPPVELLETHLFDFTGDLYGAVVDIELVAFLRPEWKLDGLAALTAQIAADAAHARRLLGRTASG